MANKFKLTIDEEELIALIEHHSVKHSVAHSPDIERSARIHDLTKRLNKKDEPEVQHELQPEITEEQAKSNIPAGW